MKWIACNYHGTKDMDNHPINFDLIVNFYKDNKRPGLIVFMHSHDHAIGWRFENDATRDKEYQRIFQILTQ